MKRLFRLSLILPLFFVLLSATLVTTEANAQANQNDRIRARITRQVRHELITLPFYNVFDWLEFEVRSDDSVVLRGQVVRPTTKSDAERRVRDLEEVSRVSNEIEVLPVSPNDDRLRRQIYYTLFSQNSPLFRYSIQAVPSIHIIVRNGRVTLKGVVNTSADKTFAATRVNTVSGVFAVKNELRVEGDN